MRLDLRSEGAELVGALVNDAGEPLEVDLVELESPSLAIEVVDADGATVYPPPPPTPGRPRPATLGPGERVELRYAVTLPAGRSRARMRFRDTVSGWIELDT